jgi:hypothetical protein
VTPDSRRSARIGDRFQWRPISHRDTVDTQDMEPLVLILVVALIVLVVLAVARRL